MAEWGRITTRGDVEDRRSFAPVAGGLGIGGVLLFMALTYLGGGSASDILSQLQYLQPQQAVQTNTYQTNDEYKVFASEVLGSTNDTWDGIFAKEGMTYSHPKLVLFRQATRSACGTATLDVGPHYCMLDNTIYLDETFFDEFKKRFGVDSGDVGQAYVIAHEVGHHVQNQLGIMEKVTQEEEQNPQEANDLSIKTELQADCYAGIWSNSIKDKGILGPNEIQEAMNEASAVGDDRIQAKVQGYITPETWTHGSSQQRLDWFNKGYETGKVDSCNTY